MPLAVQDQGPVASGATLPWARHTLYLPVLREKPRPVHGGDPDVWTAVRAALAEQVQKRKDVSRAAALPPGRPAARVPCVVRASSPDRIRPRWPDDARRGPQLEERPDSRRQTAIGRFPGKRTDSKTTETRRMGRAKRNPSSPRQTHQSATPTRDPCNETGDETPSAGATCRRSGQRPLPCLQAPAARNRSLRHLGGSLRGAVASGMDRRASRLVQFLVQHGSAPGSGCSLAAPAV